MSDVFEFEGDSVDDAVTKALEELGIERDDVDIDIVEAPSKGILGLGAKSAKIRVSLKRTTASLAVTITQEILALMNIDANVATEEVEDGLVVNITGDNLGMLIGRHGNTMDSLQFLINIIINKQSLGHKRVIIDVEGYRKQRAEEVRALAERMVGKVIDKHEDITMRPMNAYERKIVHTVVGNYEGVTSVSTGEDPDRQVVISPS